eukprot:TRINITY_DN2630_c0_g1_i1.p1 TRINITY_DN2630_c0_g1~~TRINITY_DN2630_c0_g1_i1.p1  ORF type:complete len:780 (+),score=173.99 TRINITY_DN2630_c0_g1_i1:143-2482(+)
MALVWAKKDGVLYWPAETKEVGFATVTDRILIKFIGTEVIEIVKNDEVLDFEEHFVELLEKAEGLPHYGALKDAVLEAEVYRRRLQNQNSSPLESPKKSTTPNTKKTPSKQPSMPKAVSSPKPANQRSASSGMAVGSTSSPAKPAQTPPKVASKSPKSAKSPKRVETRSSEPDSSKRPSKKRTPQDAPEESTKVKKPKTISNTDVAAVESDAKKTKGKKPHEKKPFLKEMPQLDRAKIHVERPKDCFHYGTIVNGEIRCLCCSEVYNPTQFLVHIGESPAGYKKFNMINGESLSTYRKCLLCGCKSSPAWTEQGLCQGCDATAKPKEKKEISKSTNFFECREPGDTQVGVRQKTVEIKRFTVEQFKDESFDDLVINNKEPVILTGFTGKKPKIWSLKYMITKQKEHPKQNEPTIDLVNIVVDKRDQSQCFTIHSEKCTFEDLKSTITEEKNYLATEKRVISFAKEFKFDKKGYFPEWLSDITDSFPTKIIPGGRGDMLRFLQMKERPKLWDSFIGANGSRVPLHGLPHACVSFHAHMFGEGVQSWRLVSPDDLDKLKEIVKEKGGSLDSLSSLNNHHGFWLPFSELEATGCRIYSCELKKGEILIIPPDMAQTMLTMGGLSCSVSSSILVDSLAPTSWKADQKLREYGGMKNSYYPFKKIIYMAFKTAVNNKEKKKIGALLPIFSEILEEEKLGDKWTVELEILPPENAMITCDICTAKIFNRHFVCRICKTLDYCVQCFTKFGKAHEHKLKPKEQIAFSELEKLERKAKKILSEEKNK